jgi:uncharacterized membrane protein YdjX (TVP38/TMEM64 family)
MPFWRFTLYTAVGSLPWVLALTLPGAHRPEPPAARGPTAVVVPPCGKLRDDAIQLAYRVALGE